MFRKRSPITELGNVSNKYAVVIDAGSSGSRVQVFSWKDPKELQSRLLSAQTASSSGALSDGENLILGSVPEITQDPKYNKKISPGLSSFAGKTKNLWSGHLSQLMSFAESGIPKESQPSTPVFLLATAGMRLLSESDQQDILKTACHELQSKTSFYLPECSSHVSIIDGETEGLYGWISLNYLLKSFSSASDLKLSADKQQHRSFGFMDMGGASIQIAFSPNSTETERHLNDLYHLRLRSLDGENQEWRVFVSSWLGFGANEARRRYAQHIINEDHFLSHGHDDKYPTDPCFPSGLTHDMKINTNVTMTFEGEGNFTTCLESMQPLLRKDQPCQEDPCLFNGVHAPAVDFGTDKFVGVSEYWYTANDIFKLGGNYDFETFSSHVAQYCGMEWSEIQQEAKPGGRFHGIPEDKLSTACFKATWVINILHSGFQLPIDESGQVLSLDSSGKLSRSVSSSALQRRSAHVGDLISPFTSASSVEGSELTWMLGRAVLYASSQVPPTSAGASDVGFLPAEISSKHYVLGGELNGVSPPETIESSDFPRLQTSSRAGITQVLGSFALFVVIGYLLMYSCNIVRHKRYVNWAMLKLSVMSTPKVLSRFFGAAVRTVFGDGYGSNNKFGLGYQRVLEEGGAGGPGSNNYSINGRSTPVNGSSMDLAHSSPPTSFGVLNSISTTALNKIFAENPGLEAAPFYNHSLHQPDTPFLPMSHAGKSTSMVDLSQFQNLRPPSRPSSRVSLFSSTANHWNPQISAVSGGGGTSIAAVGGSGTHPGMLRAGTVTPQLHNGFLSPKLDPTNVVDDSNLSLSNITSSPPLKRPSSRVFKKNM